ncbi:MAG: hypothetical protein SGJ24_10660 [Chloroflexota bacterium]|nr:hypothetical protein [Chloroflexota bacterium]
MKNRRTTVIVLGLVFIGVAIWSLTTPPGTSAPATPAGTPILPFYRVFPDLAVLDIAAVQLRSPETQAVLAVRVDSDGVWQAIAPQGVPDPAQMTALARTLVLLPYTTTLVSDSALTVYGFIPEGILSIELLLTDGSTAAIAVGYRTPSEQGYYAVVDDRAELYILDRAPVDYLISLLRNPPIA